MISPAICYTIVGCPCLLYLMVIFLLSFLLVRKKKANNRTYYTQAAIENPVIHHNPTHFSTIYLLPHCALLLSLCERSHTPSINLALVIIITSHLSTYHLPALEIHTTLPMMHIFCVFVLCL